MSYKFKAFFLLSIPVSFRKQLIYVRRNGENRKYRNCCSNCVSFFPKLFVSLSNGLILKLHRVENTDRTSSDTFFYEKKPSCRHVCAIRLTRKWAKAPRELLYVGLRLLNWNAMGRKLLRWKLLLNHLQIGQSRLGKKSTAGKKR